MTYTKEEILAIDHAVTTIADKAWGYMAPALTARLKEHDYCKSCTFVSAFGSVMINVMDQQKRHDLGAPVVERALLSMVFNRAIVKAGPNKWNDIPAGMPTELRKLMVGILGMTVFTGKQSHTSAGPDEDWITGPFEEGMTSAMQDINAHFRAKDRPTLGEYMSVFSSVLGEITSRIMVEMVSAGMSHDDLMNNIVQGFVFAAETFHREEMPADVYLPFALGAITECYSTNGELHVDMDGGMGGARKLGENVVVGKFGPH